MDWKEALKELGATEAPDAEAQDKGQRAAEEAAGAAEGVQKEPVYVVYERKGRNGKPATIIHGFTCSDGRLKELARELKQRTGVGGSQRDGEILLQGDCRQKAADMLRTMGYKVKGI